MPIRFDDRVAIVTGAGAGIGREHALLLASRGARVVVNDPGGSVDGSGGGRAVADQVVTEIKEAGGEAIASYASVTDEAAAQSIVDAAVNAWGRLDILVNNAGILRDKAFANMSMDDFRECSDVHYMGTVYCTKAAWPVMRSRKYGRIVVTTSGSGTSGNFGQANYGAAKMAVVGLINVLRIEGGKYNVLINAISPSARTRMTEDLLPPHLREFMKPELISPAVAWLCSENCSITGEIITASGGGFARLQYYRSAGVQFDPLEPVTVEMVDEAMPKILDMTDAAPQTRNRERMEASLRAMGRIK
ncbi:MAG: SDR family NAD(P)-dependent oxidoreductase [Pseudomonadota bacterium]|nr:SDR family NAD(P)-dependent oxidoreductase [Pseudomonadota bacterium]